MLRLDSTLRKIEILLGGVVASNQLAFVASWSDATTTSYSGGATPGVTSDTTPVTVVDAPVAGVVRDVDYVSVVNRDTFAAVVTLQYNDNGTSYPIVVITLEVGSQLVYTHGSGWNVVDASGSFKTGVAGPAGGTGASGPTGPAVYLVGEDGADGLDGVPGRAGLDGANGLTGAVGPVGPALFMVAEDPEESLQGSPGSRGAPGETGSQGPNGPAIFLTAEDPEQGEYGAPGKTGIDGTTGSQGPVGPVVMWDYPDESDLSMLGGGGVFTASSIASCVRLNTANGYGSTNNKIRRFTNVVLNQGSDITYADSATLGASFTVNSPGVYAVSFSDQFNVVDSAGVSLNTTAPTTAIAAIPVTEILTAATSGGNTFAVFAGWTGYLQSGSVLRAHNGGSPSGANALLCQFTITKVL